MAKVNISIKVNPSFDKVGKFFNDPRIRGFLQEKIEQLSFMIERESKKVTPVDTGRLRSSIQTKIRPLVGIISPDTQYDIFVHEGTRFMRSRPFMKIGSDIASEGFDTIIANDLTDYIQRELP